MSLATLMYATNDTLVKLATNDLTPTNAMFFRGVAAVLWIVPFLLVTRRRLNFRAMTNPWVLFRSGLHLGSVICFMASIQHLPLGDLVALGQLSPALLIVGVWMVWGEAIGRLRLAFVVLALIGALMLARPGQDGFSAYALLGLASAVLGALRDMIGRQIPLEIPVLEVVMANLLFEIVGAGLFATATSSWAMPAPLIIGMLAGSGLFLAIGHSLFFLSYRVGTIGRVAPFYYLYPLWSFLSGMLVFGDPISGIGLAGIVMILASGVAIVVTHAEEARPDSTQESTPSRSEP
jgi:drug/metabolite transporter (DMT)-like permease